MQYLAVRSNLKQDRVFFALFLRGLNHPAGSSKSKQLIAGNAQMLLSAGKLTLPWFSLERARTRLQAVLRAVQQEQLGYTLLIAARPEGV